MLTRLKPRQRADRFADKAPRPRRHWDRTIYLGLLALFFVALGNYLLGDRLFLRADGVVMRERMVVATTAMVRVGEVAVRPGQRVAPGDLLFQADSLDILGRLADLSVQDARLAEREASLRSEYELSKSLLPRAEIRLEDLRFRVAQLDQRVTKRALTVNRREGAQTELHESETEVLSLRSRIAGLENEIMAVSDARRHAGKAIEDMRQQYGGGRHVARVAGIVGEDVPNPGQVFSPGEPMLTILYGDPYVLTYLPDVYLLGLDEGDRVTIVTGNSGHGGVIEQVLAVSKSLPDEFRTAFRLDESRQLARVRLDPDAPFPAFSPVTVSKPLAFGGSVVREPVSLTADAVISGVRSFYGDAMGRIAKLLRRSPDDPGRFAQRLG